jgi:hypothetical protein
LLLSQPRRQPSRRNRNKRLGRHSWVWTDTTRSAKDPIAFLERISLRCSIPACVDSSKSSTASVSIPGSTPLHLPFDQLMAQHLQHLGAHQIADQYLQYGIWSNCLLIDVAVAKLAQGAFRSSHIYHSIRSCLGASKSLELVSIQPSNLLAKFRLLLISTMSPSPR